MRKRLLILVMLGLATLVFVVALPVGTLSAFGRCNSDDDEWWSPNCRLLNLRLLAPVPTPVPIPITATDGILPFTYGYVVTGPVAVYANPADPGRGAPPLKTINRGYVWVRLEGKVVQNDQLWYLTDTGGYLPASVVAIYKPSSFHGIMPSAQPVVPFAWVLQRVQTSPEPGAQPDANSVQFKRYDLVNIFEQREVNGKVWYRVGNNHWLIQTTLAIVEPKPRPPEVGPGDKWIEIGLFEQTLAAYEGDRMVYATLVSSGLPQWSTVKGIYRIHTKIAWGPMVGREGQPDFYSLEGVPWSMYFFQDYALHGAYWHDGFGWQHSHGCVNLAPADAKWLYDWTTPVTLATRGSKLATKAEPGTWVWVHD